MGPQVPFADFCGTDNTRNEDAPDVLEISAPRLRDEGEWNEKAGKHSYEDRDHVPNRDIDSKNRRRDKQPEDKTCARAHDSGDNNSHVSRMGTLLLLKEIGVSPAIVRLSLFEGHLCLTEFAEVGRGIGVAKHLKSLSHDGDPLSLLIGLTCLAAKKAKIVAARKK
jgi:hypothetical protein